MTDRKIPTIDIGRGVQYAKVASRLAELHADNADSLIEVKTSYDVVEGVGVIFSAKVLTRNGAFTGHSCGKITGREKGFEKLETVAVGRALAFAGYLASGEIASAEEMSDVVTTAQLNALKLRYAASFPELDEMDRVTRLKAFIDWCRDMIDEDVDYNDPGNWHREWYETCWHSLVAGVSDEVPFE